jgi:hypothetical protein
MMELRPPLALAASLVGVFAIFHGYAHGSALPAGESGLLCSISFVMATGCLHAVGISIGLVHRWSGASALFAWLALRLPPPDYFLMWEVLHDARQQTPPIDRSLVIAAAHKR